MSGPWRGVGLALALLAPSLAVQAQAPGAAVVVTPRPFGLAASLLATRGDEAVLPDLREPRDAGLVEAEAGSLPEVAPRATLDSSITTKLMLQTTTYQPLSTSYSTSPTYADRIYTDRIYADRINTIPELSNPVPGPTTTPDAGAPTTQDAPPPPGVQDPYADYYARMEQLQARERRRQFEREQQQRVFEILQGKVEEIAALRQRREEAARARLEAMRDVRGPSGLSAINLLEGLYIDRGVDLQQSEILHIDHHVYQDANPETGFFYFAPKRYDLQWDSRNQYAMTVIYGMAGHQATEGEVFMAARLQAGVDLAEIRLAEDLLLAYLRRNASDGNTRYRELRPLPLAASSDVELFGGAENQFSVPPDKISVQGITSLLDSMDVSWATDVRRLLNVESLLRTDANIHGSITLHASGDESLSRTIPLEIAVATPATFGRIPFDRARGWVNTSRYPVQLQSLHALMLAPEDGNGIRRDQPVVFTWSLDGARVPPGTHLQWNASAVPAWLEANAKSIWVRYAVESACEPCDDSVFTAKFIPPPPSTRQVVFTTGDVFESTGAYHIRIHVRSPFLDPQHGRVRVAPSVLLEADGAEVPIARLFLTDREMDGAGASEPLYEFRTDVIMRDGTVHRSGWVASRSLDFLLGSASLEQALGYLPGPEGPAS